MAEYRAIYTKMWADDQWFPDLTTEAKLFWIYLLTNSRASVAGIYMLRSQVAAVESGLDLQTVERLFAEFQSAGKVQREGSVIWITKLREYQSTGSESVLKRIAKDLDSIPDCDLKSRYIQHYHPIDTVPTPCSDRPNKVSTECRDTDTDTEKDTETEKDTSAHAPICPRLLRKWIDLFRPGTVPTPKERQAAIALIAELDNYDEDKAVAWLIAWYENKYEAWRENRKDPKPPALQYHKIPLQEYLNGGSLPSKNGNANTCPRDHREHEFRGKKYYIPIKEWDYVMMTTGDARADYLKMVATEAES